MFFWTLGSAGVILGSLWFGVECMDAWLLSHAGDLPPLRDYDDDLALWVEHQRQLAHDQLVFDAWGERNTSLMSVLDPVSAGVTPSLTALQGVDLSGVSAMAVGARAAYAPLFQHLDWLSLLDYTSRAEPVRWRN